VFAAWGLTLLCGATEKGLSGLLSTSARIGVIRNKRNPHPSHLFHCSRTLAATLCRTTIGRTIGTVVNGPYTEITGNSLSFWPSNEKDTGQTPVPPAKMKKPEGSSTRIAGWLKRTSHRQPS
jgi:hypothetical protein